MPADERIAAIHWVMEAPLELLTRFLYPALYPVHDPASGPWGISDQEGRVQVMSWNGGVCADTKTQNPEFFNAFPFPLLALLPSP